ncbi:MAG: hypothetical protein A2204_04450 [Elusimicrobia bacterium RIFOXYA1_FULL_47_7]|nr:MAG: hypothetical protein A2204_04450 [Elusimicrobia bacterium RIFOXYA1_FULL_47_7]OGS16712.1 MAG: hypothetical protein A2251_00835 [Elusimicrobia bacterium RIFOXYA2_FULL_47_53]OGS26765.1 MAG: hypothetical protein A2339_04090 [Elusimicrobia bacterium RIFOXYB12_FULL_50_12]OGS31671.1 MAG: hypothetical protein A2323_05665 [Elusimicrobia bacterium RIFOXYB2_FULL_46_23]
MTIIFKLLAVSLTGIVFFYAIKILSSRMAMNTKDKAIGKNSVAWFNLDFKKIYPELLKDHNSGKSKNIKLLVACAVTVLSFIVIGKILFALICGFAVYTAINMYFNKIRNRKIKLFDDQIIEALGMITSSVRAGQSLIQAVENMVKNMKPPVSDVFGEALNNIKMGMPVNDAFMKISEKFDSKDLRLAVLSMNLARESGGNIGEILTRLCDTMRERKKIQGKVEALTAQGKASGMVMSAVPFLLLLVLYAMEPGMTGLLFSTFLGNILLTIVIAMISLGYFVINKIVQIDI